MTSLCASYPLPLSHRRRGSALPGPRDSKSRDGEDSPDLGLLTTQQRGLAGREREGRGRETGREREGGRGRGGRRGESGQGREGVEERIGRSSSRGRKTTDPGK